MARGRKPQGDQSLTGAERQARYRARHARAPVVRYRRPSIAAQNRGADRVLPDRYADTGDHRAVAAMGF
jgi:hypothetical protein